MDDAPSQQSKSKRGRPRKYHNSTEQRLGSNAKQRERRAQHRSTAAEPQIQFDPRSFNQQTDPESSTSITLAVQGLEISHNSDRDAIHDAHDIRDAHDAHNAHNAHDAHDTYQGYRAYNTEIADDTETDDVNYADNDDDVYETEDSDDDASNDIMQQMKRFSKLFDFSNCRD